MINDRSRSMMNVLQVVPSVSRAEAGVWFAARGLAEALAAEGRVNVTVSGPRRSDSRDLAAELARRGVQVTPLESIGAGAIELPIHAKRDLATAAPAVLHIHGLWRPTSARIVAQRSFRGLPRVVSPHGMLEPWALRRSAWKKRLAGLVYENRLIGGAHVVHALCEAEVTSIRCYGHRGPVCLVPNGVAVPVPSSRKTVGNGDSDRLTLLYLGRIDHKKGLHLLLPALARALADHAVSRSWQLLIAGFGDADYEASLRQAVAIAGLQDRVQFLGPVFGTDKESLLAAADGFVLPSYSEGLPMAILEAASHAIPILCTAECNLPEIFACGGGRRLSLNDTQMADELRDFFLLDSEGRRRMGVAARELVVARYQWSQVAAAFEAVYAWSAGTGPRPSCVISD